MRSLIALLTLALLAGGPLAAVAQDAKKDAKKAETVSYTHLTLPTKA